MGLCLILLHVYRLKWFTRCYIKQDTVIYYQEQYAMGVEYVTYVFDSKLSSANGKGCVHVDGGTASSTWCPSSSTSKIVEGSLYCVGPVTTLSNTERSLSSDRLNSRKLSCFACGLLGCPLLPNCWKHHQEYYEILQTHSNIWEFRISQATCTQLPFIQIFVSKHAVEYFIQ